MDDLIINAVYVDPTEFPIEYQLFVYQYWLDKRGDRFAPSWDDIDFMDFPPKTIPHMLVTDVDTETFDATYRFWGTYMTQLHGHDYTGESVSSLLPAQVGSHAKSAYIKLCQEKKPHLEIKEYFNNRNLRGREIVLRVPLSSDGVIVTNTISATYHEVIDSTRPHAQFFDHILEK